MSFYMYNEMGIYSGEYNAPSGTRPVNCVDIAPDFNNLPEGYVFKIQGGQWVPTIPISMPIILPDPNIEIKAQLQELDDKSIRSMREWITSQPNPPQWLIDYNAQADELRSKLIT